MTAVAPVSASTFTVTIPDRPVRPAPSVACNWMVCAPAATGTVALYVDHATELRDKTTPSSSTSIRTTAVDPLPAPLTATLTFELPPRKYRAPVRGALMLTTGGPSTLTVTIDDRADWPR